MRLRCLSAICMLFLCLVGCEKDQVYEGLYVGMQHREHIVNPDQDSDLQEQQSYDQYKRERDESLGKDDN